MVFYKKKEYPSIGHLAKELNLDETSIGYWMLEGLVLSDAVEYTRLNISPLEKGQQIWTSSIAYDGQIFDSIEAFADAYELSLLVVKNKLELGVSLEAIVGTRTIAQKKTSIRAFTHNGEVYESLQDFAIRNNMPYDVVRRRITMGCSYDEALSPLYSLPFEFKRGEMGAINIQYQGEEYPSIRKFAKKFNLNYNKVAAMIRLEEPVDKIIKETKLRSRKIEYQGVTYPNKKEFTKKYKLPYEKFLNLYDKKMSIDDIIKTLQFEE